MYLYVVDRAQTKPDLAQRGCCERGDAPAGMGGVGPVADLESAWAGPAHQAGTAYDRPLPILNRVLEPLALVPGDLAVGEKLRDRVAPMVRCEGHPWT
jgi:hypothetical protein